MTRTRISRILVATVLLFATALFVRARAVAANYRDVTPTPKSPDSKMTYAHLINNVIGWGYNGHALLAVNSSEYGSPTDENVIDIPAPASYFYDPSYDSFRIVALAVGDQHTLFLSCAGTVLSTGYKNYIGRYLENASEDYSHDARPIEYKNGVGPLDLAYPEDLDEVTHTPLIIKIASYGRHSLALSLHHYVYVWGDNSHGYLGLGNLEGQTFPKVLSLEGALGYLPISDLCAGSEHSLLLTKDGKVIAFGSNEFGYLGINSKDQIRTSPSVIEFGVDSSGHARVASKLYCGPKNSYIITTDGELLAWGYNEGGVLGLGNDPYFTKPTPAYYKLSIMGVRINCLSIGRYTTVYGDGRGNTYYSGRNLLDWHQTTSTFISPLPSVLPTGIEAFRCSHDCCFAVYGSEIKSFCSPAEAGGSLSGQSGNRTYPLGDRVTHVDTSRVPGLKELFYLQASSESKSLVAIDDPQLVCAGYHWKDNRTCNARGRCVLTNVCICVTGYGGLLCDEIQCFGNPVNNSNVCSGHGSCLGPDRCYCADPYAGDDCSSVVQCNAVSALDANVCSGHGQCIRGESVSGADGICKCSLLFEGPNCERMKQSAIWVLATVPVGIACGLIVLIVTVVSICSSVRLRRMLNKRYRIITSQTRDSGSFGPTNSYGSTNSNGDSGHFRGFGAISDLDGKALEISVSSNLIIPKESIQIGNLIGQGSYAQVYYGTFSNVAVALKVYYKADFVSHYLTIEDFLREADLLASFGNFPFIVRLLGVVDFGAKIALVQELCEQGSLASYIVKLNNPTVFAYQSEGSSEEIVSTRYMRFRSSSSPEDNELSTIGSPGVVPPSPSTPKTKSRKRMPFDVKLNILLGIASAMEFLHSRGLIHRDLKCENILLDSSLKPRIADFGFSRLLNPDQSGGVTANMTMNIGTASYIAPELIRDNDGEIKGDETDENDLESSLNSNERSSLIRQSQGSSRSNSSKGDYGYNEKIDVYSFGILMYCVLFDTIRPYKRKPDIDIIVGVLNKNIRPAIDYSEISAIVADYHQSIETQGNLSKSHYDALVGKMSIYLYQCIELMYRCWDGQPKKRPSMHDSAECLKRSQAALK